MGTSPHVGPHVEKMVHIEIGKPKSKPILLETEGWKDIKMSVAAGWVQERGQHQAPVQTKSSETGGLCAMKVGHLLLLAA